MPAVTSALPPSGGLFMRCFGGDAVWGARKIAQELRDVRHELASIREQLERNRRALQRIADYLAIIRDHTEGGDAHGKRNTEDHG